MSVKHIKRQRVHKTQIHANKYIEHLTHKPTTTRKKERQVWECTYTSARYKVVENTRTRTFYFENILQTESVRI